MDQKDRKHIKNGIIITVASSLLGAITLAIADLFIKFGFLALLRKIALSIWGHLNSPTDLPWFIFYLILIVLLIRLIPIIPFYKIYRKDKFYGVVCRWSIYKSYGETRVLSLRYFCPNCDMQLIEDWKNKRRVFLCEKCGEAIDIVVADSYKREHLIGYEILRRIRTHEWIARWIRPMRDERFQEGK